MLQWIRHWHTVTACTEILASVKHHKGIRSSKYSAFNPEKHNMVQEGVIASSLMYKLNLMKKSIVFPVEIRP